MKFFGFLVGVYILGVLANGVLIQYVEDPYSCKEEDRILFFCPWSPERDQDPNQNEITRRVLLWPAYLVDIYVKLAKDNEAEPLSR